MTLTVLILTCICHIWLSLYILSPAWRPLEYFMVVSLPDIQTCCIIPVISFPQSFLTSVAMQMTYALVKNIIHLFCLLVLGNLKGLNSASPGTSYYWGRIEISYNLREWELTIFADVILWWSHLSFTQNNIMCPGLQTWYIKSTR